MGAHHPAQSIRARRAMREVAWVRVALTPAFWIITAHEPDAPRWLLLLGLTGSAAWVASTSRSMLAQDGPPLRLTTIIAGDVVALGVGAALTDGSGAPYLLVALLGVSLLPVTLSARERGALLALFVLCVGGPFLVSELTAARSAGAAAAFWATLFVGAALTVVGARLEGGRREEMRLLVAERDELLLRTAALTEDRHRRASQGLHDEVLQHLLAVGQDLDEAERTAPSGEVRAARSTLRASVSALRAAVVDLSPRPLAGPGLPMALRALVDAHRAAGVGVVAHVDQRASGPADEQLLAVARESLTRIVADADGGDVEVALAARDEQVALTVRLAGLDAPPPREEGLSATAVGLLWAERSLRGAGGGLEAHFEEGHLTHVHAWGPTHRAATAEARGAANVVPAPREARALSAVRASSWPRPTRARQHGT